MKRKPPSGIIWHTPLAAYDLRHVKAGLLWGYARFDLGGGQHAFVATPEKALLDLLYLQPGADAPDYLRELCLQNLERLDLEALMHQAGRAHSLKLERAVAAVRELA